MRCLNTCRYWVSGAVLLFCLAFLVGAHFPKFDGPSAYEKAQQATVIVQAKNASGSGAVIRRTSPEGNTRLFVWTAAHVVDDADEFSIETRVRNEARKVGNVSFKAKVIMRDVKSDLALLWLDAPDGFFGYVEFDTVAQRSFGHPVFHVGNFLGSSQFDDSVSWGYISQIGVRPDSGWDWTAIDQADMVILPGSSGGPLFSKHSKKVLGIVVAWPRLPGVNFYVPLRQISLSARNARVAWALYGHECPDDLTLDKLVKSSKLPVKNESVPEIKPEPPAKAVEPPKKPLRRFTFRGW